MIGDHNFGGASHDPVGKALDARGGAMSQAFCRSSAPTPRGPKSSRRGIASGHGVNEHLMFASRDGSTIVAHSAFVLSL